MACPSHGDERNIEEMGGGYKDARAQWWHCIETEQFLTNSSIVLLFVVDASR
jgi:hypothetical protein